MRRNADRKSKEQNAQSERSSAATVMILWTASAPPDCSTPNWCCPTASRISWRRVEQQALATYLRGTLPDAITRVPPDGFSRPAKRPANNRSKASGGAVPQAICESTCAVARPAPSTRPMGNQCS
eukprot:3210288-Alexandrium_andersonii.AAC.1